MVILENTDHFSIGLSKLSVGRAITVYDKREDLSMHLYDDSADEFIIAMNYINNTRTHPGSWHYNRTLNESIMYLIENFSMSTRKA